MPEIDPWKHADFIYACYIIVGLAITVLTLWIIKDERRQNERLEELNKQKDKK